MRRPWMTSFVAVALFSLTAHADEHRFALDLGGARYGFVRAAVIDGKQLVVTTPDIAPSLVALVDGFTQGKPVKRDVRLSSGAVIRKANDARLVSVKLPALGSGGAADLELTFAVTALTTQPLLSAKEAPPPPASARITTFRVDIGAMPPIEAPKIDSITLTQKPDGSATTGELAIEVAAGGAPPFVAWQKASTAKPSPRVMHVEYVGADGAAVVKLTFERCTPSAVKPLGASATTRITLSCATVRGGG